MIALYDHIQQLRLELANNPCPVERAQIETELAAAEAAQALVQAAFVASFDDG